MPLSRAAALAGAALLAASTLRLAAARAADPGAPGPVVEGAASPRAADPGAPGPAAEGAASPRARAVDVNVEGRRTSTVSPRDPTAASYVIRTDRLRSPGATAAKVLSRVPGVQVARTGSAADLATASIRGASSAETPVYLAGVRINDDVTGTADLSVVPLWMIQRAEVYRGNAPADADRLGIGGAVFFEPALPRGTRAGAGLGAGSFGELSTWASTSIGDERAGAMLAIGRHAADNDYPYVDDRGTRYDASDDAVKRRSNADFEGYDLWSIGRYRLPGGGGVTTIVNGFSRDQGLTGLGVIAARAARAHVQRWLGAVSASAPCAGEREGGIERCRIELKSSAIVVRQHIWNPLRELALRTRLTAHQGERASGQAVLRYRIADQLAASLSVAQEVERLRIERAGEPPGASSLTTSRASASASYDLGDALQLFAVLALERRETLLGGGGERTALDPGGRLGAQLRLVDGLSLFANAGRTVRVPTLGELYGVSPVVAGNLELQPERGLTFELGSRLSAGWPSARAEAFVEVVGFSRFVTDLVAYRRSGLALVPRNVSSARVLGLEVTASASALDHLRAELVLTALDPRDTTDSRQAVNDLLSLQSRLVAAPSIEVYAEPHGRFGVDRASLGARLRYRASRPFEPAGLVVIPEQVAVDLELAALALGERVSARAAIADVFDVDTVDLIGFPLPGRSAHASLEVWW